MRKRESSAAASRHSTGLRLGSVEYTGEEGEGAGHKVFHPNVHNAFR